MQTEIAKLPRDDLIHARVPEPLKDLLYDMSSRRETMTDILIAAIIAEAQKRGFIDEE
jgi:hypothetical protein